MQSLVNADLMEHPEAYSFFHWMRLWTSQPQNSTLKLIPNPSLRCPTSDIESIENDGIQTRLMLNFMGLYGVSSPLPDSLIQGIHLDLESMRPWRGLLDLFNHRIYQLYFDSWKSRLPQVLWETGHTEWGGRFSHKWQKPSVSQLRIWFGNWLGESDISIESFFPVRIPNPAQFALGVSRLDGNAYIGSHCETLLHSVRVWVRKVPLSKVKGYKSQSGSALRCYLQERLAALLNSPLQVYLHIESEVPLVRQAGMGELGMGCWLGNENLSPLVWETVV